jgi:hypothetical protein
MWTGILIGAAVAVIALLLLLTLISALGAAVIARSAQEEVDEIRHHLMDRDLLDLLGDEDDL